LPNPIIRATQASPLNLQGNNYPTAGPAWERANFRVASLAGMTLDRTVAAIERGLPQGLHVGAQLYVSLRGQMIADLAFGIARSGVAMTSDTLMLWLSAGKPVSAVAIAQLWERGLLELDDPVAQHIPEFAAGGKQAITIRHILTHTAGFRAVLGHWEDKPWEQLVAAVNNARLEPRWTVGQTAGYHPLTSWYVLGELVRRLDGRPFDRYVREAIFLPAGMVDSWIGLPPQQYRAYGDRIGLMHDTRQGKSGPNYFIDTERGAAQCRPPSGARGPARELGRFYEMLLNRGRASVGATPASRSTRSVDTLEDSRLRRDATQASPLQGSSHRIVTSQTVEALSAHHRVGVYDKTFRHIVDWGLGFVMQSNQYGVDTVPYGFGKHASPRTFGHSGSRSSISYADPTHGLAVACIFNGAPEEAAHDARMREVNAAIYEDLELVAS
jgi:CubicO group peptidase (beta-lactamase class C family)